MQAIRLQIIQKACKSFQKGKFDVTKRPGPNKTFILKSYCNLNFGRDEESLTNKIGCAKLGWIYGVLLAMNLGIITNYFRGSVFL